MVNEDYLLLLFVIPLIVLPLMLFSTWRRQVAMRNLADKKLMGVINEHASNSRRTAKSLIILISIILIVVGLSRPRWNAKARPVQSKGRDVVILLDVSRSMLAEDIKPSRLERAKLAINDLIDNLSGDRLGVVVFAGDASVRCPLTQDYGFIKLVLDEITTQSSNVGGTNLGDAIRMASNEVFDNTPKDFKDIILITDGGDLESSLPIEAASAAGDKGIRIIAVGIGDKNEGSRIPIYAEDGKRSFLEYNGEQIWTKLEDTTLREVARASSNGKYIPAETGAFDLGEIYDGIIASSQKRELEEKVQMEYEEKFQIFLCAAFILLTSEMLIGTRKKREKK